MVIALLQFVTALMLAASETPSAECVSRLGPEERLIYDAAAAKLQPGAKPGSVVRAATIGLVRQGKIPMRAAPKAAKGAARCLAPDAAG